MGFLDPVLRPNSRGLSKSGNLFELQCEKRGDGSCPTSLGGLEENWRDGGILKSIKCGLYKLSIAAHTFFLDTDGTLLIAELRQELRGSEGLFLVTCQRGDMRLFLNLLLQFLFTAQPS